MYFNRFDICEAYYLYAVDYHEGKHSRIYAIFGRLSRMTFKPSPLLGCQSLTENGYDIYLDLIKRNHLNGSK